MTTALTPTLRRFVNSYVFDKVWNEPFKEYRRNVKPMVLFERSVINLFRLTSDMIALPVTNTAYYVLSVSNDVFGGLVVESDDWVSLTEYNNSNRIEIKLFSKGGKILYRGKIFLKSDPLKRWLLIAIDKIMFKKILGNDYSINDIYFELYYDSDVPNDVTVYSSHITTALKQQTIFNTIKASTTNVIVNGRPTIINVVTDLTIGDYVDVVEDNNIIFTFDVDLTTTEGNRAFLSTSDEMWKQIIHIPKEFNSDNRVITHNTCDVYAYPKTVVSGLTKGLLIHRIQDDKSFSQITHNDFAIPLYIIEDYHTLLGTNQIILTVHVREHNKNNILLPNDCYIDMLYTLPDETILDFLENQEDPTLPFWSADELEQCKYVEMFNSVPEVVTTANLTDYVNALGYHHVLSLICPRIQRMKYTSELANPFKVPKPIIFVDTPVRVHTFINGLKVDNTHTELDNYLSITLSDTSTFEDDDTLIVECFEYPINTVYEFTPTESIPAIDIAYEDFNLYQRSPSSMYKGVGKTVTSKYELIEITPQVLSATTTGGVTTLTFSPLTYDNTYIIQRDKASYSIKRDLEITIENNDPIVVDLDAQTIDSEVIQPIMAVQQAIVYLNNRELVEGVDFHILTVRDVIDEVVFNQIIIQNSSYLDDTTNTVEVLYTPLAAIDKVTSFLKSDYIPKTNIAWFDNLSMLIIDGLAVSNITSTPQGYDVSELSPRLGAIYNVRTMVPLTAQQYLESSLGVADVERRTIIDTYFNSSLPIDDTIVVIPYSHNIYSIFLATIIRDIINGSFVFGYDPVPTGVLNALSDYDYLRAFDLVYTNTTIDLRYLDYQATYSDFTAINADMYKAIHQLITVTLPVDDIIDEME